MTKEIYNLIFEKYQYPEPLSEEEQLKYFEEARKGNEAAREKLVWHSMRLVIYVIFKKFNKCNNVIEDLISVGSMGLVKAIDSYDPTKGAKFSTYAYNGIVIEINKYLRNNKQFPVKRLEDIFFEYEDGSKICYQELLLDDTDVEEQIVQNDIRDRLRIILKDFKERDQEFIKLYFGFYDRCYTTTEIGQMYGVTRALVSKKNIDNLKRIAEKLQEANFFDVQEEKTLIKR